MMDACDAQSITTNLLGNLRNEFQEGNKNCRPPQDEPPLPELTSGHSLAQAGITNAVPHFGHGTDVPAPALSTTRSWPQFSQENVMSPVDCS